MSAITTEELIQNICTLCGIKRNKEDFERGSITGRVLSKKELHIVQSVLLKQRLELEQYDNTRESIRSVVKATVVELARTSNDND